MTEVCSVEETRKNQFVVTFLCDNCGIEAKDRKSHFDRSKKHYCSRDCYASHRKLWKPSEQPTWRGGVSSTESHRRWKKKNPSRLAHLKSRYYARRKNAEGSHSYEEWKELCIAFDWLCAYCKKAYKLTKDHIIPLSKGGTDYISNIQPLCRSCNSKKHNSINENPEILSGGD